jgi:hypothetical protein
LIVVLLVAVFAIGFGVGAFVRRPHWDSTTPPAAQSVCIFTGLQEPDSPV